MVRTVYVVVALITLSLLWGCESNDTLTCGGVCYSGPAGTADNGGCRRGEWICSSTVAGGGTCVGEVLPELETCDGLDNDCNGVIDDNPRFPKPGPCETNLGACYSANAGICSGGAWSCPLVPHMEVCDGVDNDCDGIRDNIESELCFPSENKMAALYAPCRPGLTRCVGSLPDPVIEVCVGAQLPTPERCDGVDNDCNGVTDDLEGSSEAADVVVVIDRSGSMVGLLPAVAAALEALAASNFNLALWLWDLPGEGSIVSDMPRAAPNLVCYGRQPPLPLAPCAGQLLTAALQDVADPGAAFRFGGQEPSLDILTDLLAQGQSWTQWRPGATRIILFFGDESPQSSRNIRTVISGPDDPLVLLYVWDRELGNYAIAVPTASMSILNNLQVTAIIEELQSLVSPVCE